MLNVYETAFEVIDLRSFSNLWFWIMLALVWSSASHFVLGVPFDMVARAARYGGQAIDDLKAMVDINASRLLFIAETTGLWLIGFSFFMLSGLVILGFYYGVEICQAIFTIVAPMSLVFALSIRTAGHVRGLEFEDLRYRLKRHRLWVQVVGMISILFTSLWGMYVNLSVGALGN